MSWKCPKCGSMRLGVVVSGWAELDQYEDGEYGTGLVDDHEWDSTSSMRCERCSCIGEAAEFEVED